MNGWLSVAIIVVAQIAVTVFLIRAAGRVPVERDTLYNPVDRSKLPPIIPATPPGHSQQHAHPESNRDDRRAAI